MNPTDLPGIYDRAGIYEAIYRGRGKDYRADAGRIAGRVRERNPAASSLLDVACGTGSHLRSFAGIFDHVEGVDLSVDMLRVAKASVPAGVRLHHADMCRFRLDRRFDAVTCLFSSIGYLRDRAELEAAVGCFAAHATPGGVVVVEPWYFPDTFQAGRVVSDLATVDGQTIARVSHAVRRGPASHMAVHYLVADPDTGVGHFTDAHVMSLFARREYETAFVRAGCSVEYLTDGGGPGLFVGIRSGGR